MLSILSSILLSSVYFREKYLQQLLLFGELLVYGLATLLQVLDIGDELVNDFVLLLLLPLAQVVQLLRRHVLCIVFLLELPRE